MNNHGGKRENSGAKKKPESEHKKNVAIYVRQRTIEKSGGIKNLKGLLRIWVKEMFE